MKPRKIVVDLVKAAIIVLTIKVMATSSLIMQWNSSIDNLCIIFAIGVMFAKIYNLRISLKKLIILAVMGVFVLYSCVSMGQYDLLVSLIAICLLINKDIDEYVSLIFKAQVLIIFFHIAISGMLSLAGVDERFWGLSDNRIRFNGGFVHANVLSSYILSCMMMYAWKHFKHITNNQFAWMVGVAVFSYIMTRSRTGLLLNTLLLTLIYFTQRENNVVIKAINPILLLSFPTLSAFVFWAQLQYRTGNSVVLFLDTLLTGRIKYAAYAYERSGITWLPRYLDYAAEGVVSWTMYWNLNTFTFDNIYSFLFIQMGIVWIGIITAIIAVVCCKSNFKVKLFVLFWVLYAMVEVHGLNCFKFFPIILLSTLLSRKGVHNEPNSHA